MPKPPSPAEPLTVVSDECRAAIASAQAMSCKFKYDNFGKDVDAMIRHAIRTGYELGWNHALITPAAAVYNRKGVKG